MKNKKCYFLGKYFKFTIIILLLICMSSCGKRGSKIMDESNEILKKVNNDASIDELITHDIDITNKHLAWYGHTLEEINEMYNIECLRKNKNKYYAIFHTTSDCWLIYLFDQEFSEKSGKNEYVVESYMCFDKIVTLDDFKTLIVNESTLNDVRKIDPYGNEVFYASSSDPVSCHDTFDGYHVEIFYSFDEEKGRIVSSIDWASNELSVMKYITSKDLEKLQIKK